MTGGQVQSLVQLLAAAYPASTKMREPGTLELLRSFLARFEYSLAEDAIRDVIATKSSWPSIAEIAKAHDARAAARRRQAIDEQARREREAAVIEPTEDERRLQIEEAHAYIAERWGS
jgi:hypothetical protein